MKFVCKLIEPAAAARHQRGFGLLEAIVALTLLAGTGVALFAWINTNMQAAIRLKDTDSAATLKIAAVGLMSGVNPLVQPSGERQLEKLRVRWSAVASSEMRATAGQVVGGTGRFELQLFNTDVQATDLNTKQELRFDMKLLGTRLAAAANAADKR